MASFASQAALRSHYEELIDRSETDIAEGLKSAVSWFKQVLKFFPLNALINLCHSPQNALHVILRFS